MGLKNKDYERGISEAEKAIEAAHRYIPNQPLVSKETFDAITSFIVDQAPVEIAIDSQRLYRNKPLLHFERNEVPMGIEGPSSITALKFNRQANTLWVANMNNEVFQVSIQNGIRKVAEVSSPVVDFSFYNKDIYLTQIGDLMPSELSKGSFSMLEGYRVQPHLAGLHRPVFSQMEDLDLDGEPEIVVCNFGKNLGSLSVYKKAHQTGDYKEYILSKLPGATKCFIEDMNGDGKKDIVALLSQADESVYVFYNKGGLSFESKQLLRFPPYYGTTDMLLVDFNKDGALDIITAHGDNADYSIFPKKEHGIRIHLNKGKDLFSEHFFYPLYGVTRILAEDFDKDGDIDIAASAFYPEHSLLNHESFVYLEHVNNKEFEFISYTDTNALSVHSLTLEKGDIDGDGDQDILLGHFAFSPVQAPQALTKNWQAAPYGLIWFENKTIKR
jgi:hypothetical protein